MKHTEHITELLASIQAGLYAQQRPHGAEAPHARPFITISRQAGAGGRTLAGALAERLNRLDEAEQPWAVWDRELVEKVARDQRIPLSLVESLERTGPRRSMFQEFLQSLLAEQTPAEPDEYQLYRIVATTARAIARAGRAILVGRGAVYATADLSGGVHLRLVAPFEARVKHMADKLQVSSARAAAEVRHIDQYREAFHRRFWKDKALLPEIFTLTLNTAALTEQQMVECVLPLIPRPPAAQQQPPPRTDVAEVSPSAPA